MTLETLRQHAKAVWDKLPDSDHELPAQLQPGLIGMGVALFASFALSFLSVGQALGLPVFAGLAVVFLEHFTSKALIRRFAPAMVGGIAASGILYLAVNQLAWDSSSVLAVEGITAAVTQTLWRAKWNF